MSNQPEPRSIESLLAHADWVRALAGRLVTDASRADDIAQDTWVAAMERPPRDARNLKGWLASIVRNNAREEGRADQRRTAREHAVAKPEASVPSSDELVRRANLQREIAAHVVALDEPYRTIVLLRWYEGLMPRDIAARLGRPVDTITTQLARAHEQLRTKLDREHGDRSAWSAMLADLARPHVVASSGVIGGVIGGVLLSTGWKIGIGAVAVLVLGLTIWRTTSLTGVDELRDYVPSKSSLSQASALTPVGLETEVNAHAGRSSVSVDAVSTEGATPPSAELALIEAHGRVIDERGTPMPGFRFRACDHYLPHADPDGLFDQSGNRLADAKELETIRATPAAVESFVRAHALQGIREAILAVDLHVDGITDAEGRYALSVRGTSESSINIESVDPSWVVFLSAYEKPGHGLVRIVAPAVTLAGVIVDSDGVPVEGAEPSMWKYFENLRELAIDLDGRETGGVPVKMLGNGRFRMEHLPRVSGWKVDVMCPGWETVRVPVPETSDTAMRIVMHRNRPTPKISGVVLDVDGKPAANATVVFGYVSSRSDAEGRFVLASQTWRPDSDLVASKAGAIATLIPEFGRRIGAKTDDIAGIMLRLGGKPLSISGRVLTSAGAPCVGWEVDLDDATPAGGYEHSVEKISAGRGGNPATPRTDASGSFVIEGLDVRAYRLYAFSSDRTLLLRGGPFAAGATDVVLRVPDDALRPLVTGRVMTKHGAPVPGVTIAVDGFTNKNKEGWSSGLRGNATQTDQLGRFELHDVPRYNVTLEIRTSWSQWNQIPLASGDSGENLEVIAARSARFHLELSPSDPADAFEILDEDGEKLTVIANGIADKNQFTRVPRDEAGFPSCEVDDEAKSLVLLHDGIELRRVPLTLDPGKRNVIRP